MSVSTVAASPRPGPSIRVSIASALVITLQVLAVAWGAFAFGAVYPWAYWPLIAAAATAGALAFVVPGRSQSGTRTLSWCLLLFAVATAVQLVPLPRSVLAATSQARDALLTSYNLVYANTRAGTVWHPLSIAPDSTWLGLACFVAFGLFLLGSARFFSVRGTGVTIGCVLAVGLVLALAGIIQDVTYEGKIYGFWPDPYVNKPFGPFINKNNFAGWMLMAVPLALGFVVSRAVSGLRYVREDWHSRVLWISSPSGSQVLLALCASLVMGVSIVLSLSRSGIIALALTLVLVTLFLAMRRAGRVQRLLMILAVVAFLGALAAMAGTDAMAVRFNDGTAATLEGRIGAWKDASTITRTFPLVGSGLNTFPTAMLFYQVHDLYNYWSEAHNDYLQLFAEGGVLLVVPAILALVVFVRAVRQRFAEDSERRSSYWIRVGAVTALIAIGLQELVEFSLQIPGNACLFTLIGAIALHRPIPARDPATGSGS
jgi:O-antigen ligase